MNQTPPLAAPPLSNSHRDQKPRPGSPGSALPAPHSAPLPLSVPHAVQLPPFSPPRPAIFLALALSLFAFDVSCARLEVTSSPSDGGAPVLAAVDNLDPAPGAVGPNAGFTVTFATPMNASTLLADVAKSDSVILVDQANAQVMAAALVHSRLTAGEAALVIPAAATLGPQAISLLLMPSAPLAPGSYALLVATRLKDATGAKITGQTEFDYSVAFVPPAPVLIDPMNGGAAPENLARVRVSFAPGAAGSIVSLIGPKGTVGAASAPSMGGEAVISLCPDAPCAALTAGEKYTLALDGKAVDDASFTVAPCVRSAPPGMVAQDLSLRDQSAGLAMQLDWPALIRAQFVPSASDAGTVFASGFAPCPPASCADDSSGACSATIAFSGLVPSTNYRVQISLEDDEGHSATSAPIEVTTLSPLPSASLEEVMASPPDPSPRDEGEYVELRNTGLGAIDLSTLALRGADGVVRPLMGSPPLAPILLSPGGYALAVGASFDASRYAIPLGVPVLRASTQRLLSRGLSDASPPAIELVFVAAKGGAPELLSSFEGGPFHCARGESLERIQPAPMANLPQFACGKSGGSPGRAP
jgi:hypothetical protein